jgi:hypothetical protein
MPECETEKNLLEFKRTFKVAWWPFQISGQASTLAWLGLAHGLMVQSSAHRL